tara:strand:+ start:1685 stop:2485 length:801 start_codon:yes stop_codon:yes gene_type:complete
MSGKVAIIQFPGSNCERESLHALEACGISAEIIRWNASAKQLSSYQGYLLPGGFSYQDRVRAGAITSKLPIMETLLEANLALKPILGICNGCQILAESGLVPDLSGNQNLEMVLTHNENKGNQIGFICDWQFVTVKNPKQSLFTSYLEENTVIPIPVNHGEGQFRFKATEKEKLNDHSIIEYCTPSGEAPKEFPENPNNSQWNMAGISNQKGNVFAMMPHPERAFLLKQIPSSLANEWGKRKQNPNEVENKGPWHPFFMGLKKAVS